MRTGPVVADLEVPASAFDDESLLREARADIVVRCEGVDVWSSRTNSMPENSPINASASTGRGQPNRATSDGCFLRRRAAAPVTATSDAARAAWRTLSYRQLKHVVTRSHRERGAYPVLGPINGDAVSGDLEQERYAET